jgi:alanine-glyoxylate transaminase/serine-glyoxylate transaminase/serine-pyruvate transaminase
VLNGLINSNFYKSGSLVTIFPTLEIPHTLAAGPGPGNTDPRVLKAFANAGVADHMQADVIRGMIECKHMLREAWGTQNVYTYGVAGTGWSGLDCIQSIILPGDKVVVFNNGTFSGIDGLTIRMKASSAEDLAANPTDPQPANVIMINIPHGTSVSAEMAEAAIAEHKPMFAFMAHFETGSGRVNDIQGFNDACAKHDAMGMCDAVSSLGIGHFNIDDYPAIVAWASCPQKGILGLPLSYAPVSFRQEAIDLVKKRGCYTYVHHPILEARHWGVTDGVDTETSGYHRTHSSFAVASFHEALRIYLTAGRKQTADTYEYHETALKQAVTSMGCKTTSNMPSLVVMDLPASHAGREKEIVGNCRAQGFGIWPTLSEPTQIRIGILNQINQGAVTEIVDRFADAMLELGVEFDKAEVMGGLKSFYEAELAVA